MALPPCAQDTAPRHLMSASEPASASASAAVSEQAAALATAPGATQVPVPGATQASVPLAAQVPASTADSLASAVERGESSGQAGGKKPECFFFPSERCSIAPMVDVTDSIFRRMTRLMSRRVMLYTEMIAADALVHEKYHLIDFQEEELPCVLQLGGADPHKLAIATKVGVKHGYSAINLNAGCPSDKVQSGSFGAVLMKDPQHLASCYKAMQEAAGAVPVSVKTRIGVDNLDSVDFTLELIGTLYNAGCRHLIIHARKAWLKGLSPKENRTIPPLDYERVYLLKRTWPDLQITINGGITTLEQCQEHLSKVDGVMLGRAIIDNPYLLTALEQNIWEDAIASPVLAESMPTACTLPAALPPLSREEVLEKLILLGEEVIAAGKPVHLLYRHVLGLFTGCPNARLYRRYLSENMTKRNAPATVIKHAYEAMRRGLRN